MPTVRRRPSRPWAIALLTGAVGAATVLAGCSDAPSEPDLVDSLVLSGLSPAEAACAAGALYDNLPDDEIAAIAERGPSAVIDDPDVPDEPIDVARSEIAACRRATSSTTTPSSTSAVDPDTTLPVDDVPSTEGAEGPELNAGRASSWWPGAASVAR